MEARGIRQPRPASSSGMRQPPTPIMQPILKTKKDEGLSNYFDHELYNELLNDNRKTMERERDASRTLGRRDASTLKARPGAIDRAKQLEDELFAERERSQALEEEVEELRAKLETNKDEYKRNLELFSAQIKSYKSLQTELLRTKEKEENRELEIEDLKNQLEMFKSAAKATLEFVIKTFEIVALLPEQVEVESNSHEIIDFSFEEKRASFLPKTIFLEQKIVKFLEANERLVTGFQLEDLLLKIIEEYELKKANGGHLASPKLKRSSSKKTTKKDKMSPKNRSMKLRRLTDSFSGADQSSLDRSGDVATDRGLGSGAKSIGGSGGKSNNYSININLVVNDNSDSLISDNNTSATAVAPPQFQNFIRFFEKELGCEKDKSDSSIIVSDSLVYSPSDRSSKLAEACSDNRRQQTTPEKVEIVVAKFAFAKSEEGDIELTAGDKIKVISKDVSGWWIGQNLSTSQIGYFPSNFVRSL